MKNKKYIWLINQYLCSHDLNGDDHRHYSLAQEWQKKGYDVTLITSTFSHVPQRHNPIKGFFEVRNDTVRTLLVKGNHYKENRGSSRVLSWLIFFVMLFFIPTKKLPKPDIIIVSSNSLLPILNVIFYFKKRFKNVKFLLEIRDIWPMSLTELGNYSNKNIFIKFLAWVEKLGYKKADYIVSLLINTDVHIKKVLKNKPFKYSWISNGYNPSDDQEDLSKTFIDKMPRDKYIIGYAGSLGVANAMEFIIHAMNKIEDKNIYLCIVGNGNLKAQLRAIAKGNDNVIFMDRIPKNQVYTFLSKCDLLYFSYRKLSLYDYGISANKTFDYMNAEKPILLSATVNNNVIDLANCGSVVDAENVDLLVDEILKYKNMPIEERKKMGSNGKKYMLKHFTYEKLADKFIHIFDEVLL